MAELELKMNAAGVDPNLIAWLQAAARQSPYRVVAYSGKREGDPRFHGQGKAIDINLIDPKTGKTIPNYQSPEGFAAYQSFANTARAAQMQMNPEMGKLFRWGGYFGGGKGKYGALDLMHFDVGGVPTAGGSWEGGLNPAQAALWNLSPGGGASGGGVSTAGASPLGTTMAEAVETPMQKMVSDFASGVSKSKPARSDQSTSTLIADPTGQEPLVPLETPSAQIPSDYLETPGLEIPLTGAPGVPGAGLADLFQVKAIGTPPIRPGRRF